MRPSSFWRPRRLGRPPVSNLAASKNNYLGGGLGARPKAQIRPPVHAGPTLPRCRACSISAAGPNGHQGRLGSSESPVKKNHEFRESGEIAAALTGIWQNVIAQQIAGDGFGVRLFRAPESGRVLQVQRAGRRDYSIILGVVGAGLASLGPCRRARQSPAL
jgi:hypothetical protein